MKTAINTSYKTFDPTNFNFEYDDDVLSAGWNPTLDLLCEQSSQNSADGQVEVAISLTELNSTEELSTAISDLFLKKIYQYQR